MTSWTEFRHSQVNLVALPQGLLGVTLLIWGWQAELLPIAAFMALLLETAPWISTRWDLSDQNFNRVTDFSVVLCLLLAAYLFSRHSVQGIFILLIWLPLPLFVLLLAQTYSLQAGIRLSSLFFSLRHVQAEPGVPHRATQRINIAYPYFLLCLLALSITRPEYFFFIMAILLIWGLWPLRNPRYCALLWVAMLGSALLFGYVGQLSLSLLQNHVEQWVLSWIDRQYWEHNPYQRRTALGHMGDLKLSNQILFRVKASRPLLLREATYDRYEHESWYASQVNFSSLPLPTDKRWQLKSAPTAQNAQVEVAMPVLEGEAMLPLPNGTYALSMPEGVDVQQNLIDDAVKVLQAPGLLNYSANFAYPQLSDTYTEASLEVLPKLQRLRTVLQQQVERIGLLEVGLGPEDKIQRLSDYFQQNFRYSLAGDTPDWGQNPLQTFLELRKSGHCEYFATATALLLRTAGVPTRYASGFAVQEYSLLEDAYVVRRRHAHAWAEAWVNGQWLEVDTTPASWVEEEAETIGWWEPVLDLFSWLKYQFTRWQWQIADEDNKAHAWLWLLLPLSLLLVWRLRHLRKHLYRSPSALSASVDKAACSPLSPVLEQLQLDFPRLQGETLMHWLQRCFSSVEKCKELENLLNLHYRYRFSNQRMSSEEEAILYKMGVDWLEKGSFRKTPVSEKSSRL